MPATLIELHGSRNFEVNVTGGSATFLYYLHGTSSETEAYDAVLTGSPGEWFGYTRDKIDMSKREAPDQWWPVVSYSLPVFNLSDPLPTGEAGPTGFPGDTPPASSPSSAPPASGDLLDGISVSIGLENQHVQHSLKTVYSAAVGGDAPNCNRLIGLSGSGADTKIEGVDIGVAVANIVYRRTIPYLTAGYFKNILSLCGTTNEEAWWLFKAEEALFAGCNGQTKGTGEFEINFEFKYSRTKYDIDVTGQVDGHGVPLLIVPEKRGWHYLWTKNQKQKDAVANAMVERPFAVYIEQVYETSNFKWLGI